MQPILPSRPSASLEQTTWYLVSYGFQGVPQRVLEGTKVTLFFDRITHKLMGTTGCNLVFASYTAGETTLTISGLGSTKMYCSLPDGVMSQEQRVIDILSRATGYSISGTILTIITNSGQVLTFST